MKLINGTPALPHAELLSYVDRYFKTGATYQKTIEKQKPPLYILDTSILKDKARRFRDAFSRVLSNVDFYYAVKSNNHPDVAGTLLGCDFGLDVSSGLELEMALGLGAPRIVFSGPGKTNEELLLAVRNAERVTVLIDSFGELDRLQKVSKQEGKRIHAGVRLSTSNKWQKFGIAPEELYLFCRKARASSHVSLQGMQIHTSWNLRPDAQCDFIVRLGRILSTLPTDFRSQLEFLDVGGGYWPPEGEWLQPAGTREGKLSIARGDAPEPGNVHYRIPSMTIEDFADGLGHAIREHILPLMDCRIFSEPGRWLCNNSMHLIISVVDKKAADLVITDAGTNAVGWERFETDYFPVLNLTRPSMDEKPCNILGSLCTPHDIWGYTYFGDGIREGDILMIPCQGAYTYSLRQNFIKPVPKVITI